MKRDGEQVEAPLDLLLKRREEEEEED